MDFSVSRQELSSALSLVSEVIPARSIRQVLQNVQIIGNPDNTLTISGTDLEIGIRIVVPVDNLQEPETILLPGIRLSSLVREDWSETIHFSIHDNQAELRTGQGRFQLLGSAGEDFPTLSEFGNDDSVSIHGADFAEAVQKTVFATARGDVRYALNGIFLSLGDQFAEFVSSDTHRLSLVKKRIKNENHTKADGILLTKGMTVLAKLAEKEESVELQFTPRELLAKTSNAFVVIRRVEGQFPRYNDVIPPKQDRRITIKKEDFLKSLRLIGLVSNEETRSVLLETAPDKLYVSASGSETGEGRIGIDAKMEGEDVALRFNYVYLADMVKAINDESVTIQFKDSTSPTRLDSGDFTHVVMPLNR